MWLEFQKHQPGKMHAHNTAKSTSMKDACVYYLAKDNYKLPLGMTSLAN